MEIVPPVKTIAILRFGMVLFSMALCYKVHSVVLQSYGFFASFGAAHSTNRCFVVDFAQDSLRFVHCPKMNTLRSSANSINAVSALQAA
jgi:hypothetical protein